jgi:hypothetical protein
VFHDCEGTMTTIRQIIQTSPIKANELFDKLVDTSDTAVKTRERLFGDLKEELELLVNLEEQHLFPVLRKHKETRDLVHEALNDNKQTKALLDELERTPKNNGQFARKVADLRKVFQRHVRDEKKELLPTVLKVLSEDEAEAVVEKVESEVARIEESKRAEVELRRKEARRERERTEKVRQAAEATAKQVRDRIEQTQTVALTMQETMRSGLGTASELTQRSAEQALQLLGFSGREGQELVEQASQDLQAVAQSATILARGLEDVSREWFDRSQDRVYLNLEGYQALLRCRTVHDLIAVQSSLVRRNLEQTVENSQRIAELMLDVSEQAGEVMTVSRE